MDNMKPETTSYSDIRSKLTQLQSRYSGAVSPAVFSVIRALEIELAWIEHQHGHG